MNDQKVLINVENISFSYNKTTGNVLQDICFQVYEGDYLAIMGANGSGKSTLARLLAGFSAVDQGKISGDLFSLFPYNKKSTKVSCGIVFQNPQDQIMADIVCRDTAFGPENLGLSDEIIKTRVKCNLELLDILKKANSKTAILSEGEKQKLILAGVLALDSEILILDESISMINPETRYQILDFLELLNKSGRTIIHVTHNIDDALCAKKVLVLAKGKIVYHGTNTDMLKQSDAEQWGVILPEKLHKKIYNFQQTQLSRKNTSCRASLSLNEISYHYDNSKRLFNNFSLSIQENSLIAIVGDTGSGKSTLLEICAGLLKPQSGNVYADQYPLLSVQNSEHALFEEFVGDEVAFGLINRGYSNATIKQKTRNSLNMVNLPFDDFVDRRIFTLSGGEKRKVALADIIALDSKIFLFDEPSAALDPVSHCAVLEILQGMCLSGKTVLFTTHYIEDALLADRIIVLDNGKVIADGLPQRLNTEYKPEKKTVKFTDLIEKNTQQMLLVDDKSLPILSDLDMIERLRTVSKSIYQQDTTPIHRLPAVSKLVILICFLIFGIILPLRALSLIIFLGIIYALLCHYPFNHIWRNILAIVPWILVFAVFQFFFFPVLDGDKVLFSVGWFTISDSKLKFGFEMLFHFIALMIPLLVYLYSTEETEILHGVEFLLFPLSKIGMPVFHVAMLVSIIFRFIPLLLNESVQILKSQVIRGSKMNKKGLFKTIRTLIPIFIPLVIQTLNRAEAYGEALSARYYDEKIINDTIWGKKNE